MLDFNKSLILINGVPASGKSYLSKQLKHQLQAANIKTKILSVDCVQALFTQFQFASVQQILSILPNNQWETFLLTKQLNKKQFQPQKWKKSRQIVSNHSFLHFCINTCDILIIEDELPLKSQRKPFKRFCFDNNIKFLQIFIELSLCQALTNNTIRGYSNLKDMVPQQIIRNSFLKFQKSLQAYIFRPQQDNSSLSSVKIMQSLKYVTIYDNYNENQGNTKYQHKYTQKQLDENDLRKLISQIVVDEQIAKQYFLIGDKYSKKDKAIILAQAKKKYIQNKRKISFKQLVITQITKKSTQQQQF